MRTAAVVVSHGNALELDRLLPVLAAQVDELVVVANTPGSVGELPPSAVLVANPRPLGFGANVNRGVARTSAELVCSVNPDAVPRDGAVSALGAFLAAHPRAGVAGPRMLYPDGSRATVATAFSHRCRDTRPAHAAAPALRSRTSCSDVTTTSARRRPSPCRPTGCSAAS